MPDHSSPHDPLPHDPLPHDPAPNDSPPPGRDAFDREPSDRDQFDLTRFVQAQVGDYDRALAEIAGGRKRSHWMWYIFPQLQGLGRSAMAERYAIGSVAEAEAYLRHPLLGPRLVACAEAALGVAGRSAHDIFGSPDDLKLHSSVTLFARVSPPGSVFARVLERFFAGTEDAGTVRLLGG